MNNEEFLDKILFCDETLKTDEYEMLENEKKEVEEEISSLNKKLMLLDLMSYYDELKKSGKTKEEILKYYKEDKEAVKYAEEYLREHLSLKDNMFGYPANMLEPKGIMNYLRYLESKLYLRNNCGGPDPEVDRGYYLMDSKVVEMKIIETMCKNMNVDPEEYWGYVTSGGTEGNLWGINTGYELYPNAKLFYSKDGHYSIPKGAKIGNGTIQLPHKEVRSLPNGEIDADELIVSAYEAWKTEGRPALVVLTWGTTVLGACDKVKYIKEQLDNLGVPNYVHLDAAMYGGIPKNQKDAPTINDLKELNPDSISISLHKYLANPEVGGIVICKREVFDRKNSKQVEYIGQTDPTFLGSRDFLAFSTLQQIKQIIERSDENDYSKNINVFTEEMEKKNIPYFRNENGNTFVIDLPNKEIAAKYQLATFDNDTKAHIIIFPSHKEENIRNLVNDLSKYYDKPKTLKKEA